MAKEHPEMSFPAIIELPELTPLEQWYLKCFNRLERSRSVGMALGPIPLSEITDYADRLGEDIDEFVEIIEHCDSTVLKLHAEKDKVKTR